MSPWRTDACELRLAPVGHMQHRSMVLTPHLPLTPLLFAASAGIEPSVIIVMRHPVDRLVALFNSKHGRCWSQTAGVRNHSTPLQVFRSAYARAESSGVYRLLRPPSATCLLAGESLSTCIATAVQRAANATSTLPADASSPPASVETQWLKPARKRLRAASLVLVDDFERSKRMLCRTLLAGTIAADGAAVGTAAAADAFCDSLPHQLPIVLGGDGAETDAAPGNAADGGECGGSGYLTREALQGDQAVLATVRRREVADLALYAFARRLHEERLQDADGAGKESTACARVTTPAASTGLAAELRMSSGTIADGTTAAFANMSTFMVATAPADNASATEAIVNPLAAEPPPPPPPPPAFVDDWAARVRRLQLEVPPTTRMPIVFTHIPKCAGSTFRNRLLLEFTRIHRAPRDFACVLYRDVSFRERPINSTLARQGPACLGPDGYFRRRLLVITGHVSFHPSVLSRVGAPSFAAVVFVREPLSRLVSLFNMYPDGTWGPPSDNSSSPAQRFAETYRRRFEGRNALTCFIAGSSLCDSVGALSRAAISPASLRRARFNLVHRFDVVGLTERAAESMAIISWAFGWLPAWKQLQQAKLEAGQEAAGGGDKSLSALFGRERLAPGSQHRRLTREDLCAIPGLLDHMRKEEAPDVELYRLAQAVYTQRLPLVPAEVLALGATAETDSKEPACWADPRRQTHVACDIEEEEARSSLLAP